MNVLILNWRDPSHPQSGGAEIVTQKHAQSWVNAGHTVTWFTSWYKGSKKRETIDGIHMVRQGGFLTVYAAAWWYLLVHGRDFDLIIDEVHGFPYFSPFFTHKPIILFIHEIAGEIWDFMYPFPVNVIGKFLEKHYFYFYRTYQFWTDAPSTIDELVQKGIPKSQCTAIPCPISLDKTFDFKKKNETRKEKNPTYLFVSRVVKMKGIEEVIKAFSFILRVQNEAKLWIVGFGDEEYVKQLQSMMQEYGVLNNVIYWGKVTEQKKYDLMRRAHVLLHASVKEGWGLVVLEAAFVGTPSVVYNVPGLRDVVKNGKTGIVIRSNSPHEMATEALHLIDDKARYAVFQKNGKAWVESLKWSEATKASMALLQKSIRETSI